MHEDTDRAFYERRDNRKTSKCGQIMELRGLHMDLDPVFNFFAELAGFFRRAARVCDAVEWRRPAVPQARLKGSGASVPRTLPMWQVWGRAIDIEL